MKAVRLQWQFSETCSERAGNSEWQTPGSAGGLTEFDCRLFTFAASRPVRARVSVTWKQPESAQRLAGEVIAARDPGLRGKLITGEEIRS